MNDTFMKGETGIASDFIHVPAYGVIHAGQFPLQHCGQFFRRADQRGGYDGIIVGLPGSKFYQCCGIGFGVGINAVIAFYLGAGDHEKTDQAATQGLVLARDSWRCYDSLLYRHHAGFPADVSLHPKRSLNLASAYSIVAFAFTLIVTVSMAFEKLFQAVGNMKTTMISLMCGCITNIVLDPVLIFGYGPFPEMGIEGAALATGIGQALTLGDLPCSLSFAANSRAYPQAVHFAQQKMVIKLYSIGIPATLNLALPSLLISALNAILAGLFRSVYSGFGDLLQIARPSSIFRRMALCRGMRPLIGYNYGAGEHKRVSQIYQIVLCMSGIIMVLGTAICLLIPGQLIGLFTHTEATIQAGETALRIIGAGFIVSGGFCYFFRRIGGAGERHALLTDFSLPVCSGNHPGCVFTQQVSRSGWRLECVLDHGSDYCDHIHLRLPQGNSKASRASQRSS